MRRLTDLEKAFSKPSKFAEELLYIYLAELAVIVILVALIL